MLFHFCVLAPCMFDYLAHVSHALFCRLDGSKNGNDSDVSEKSTKLYRPSETYKLIHEREGSGDATEPESVHQTHSKTFSVLQKQLDG